MTNSGGVEKCEQIFLDLRFLTNMKIQNLTNMRRKNNLVKLIFFTVTFVFFCEYLLYYIVVSQCSWPVLESNQADKPFYFEPDNNSEAVRAMFIADIHLLGSGRGGWFDKLRREWQMYRSFQTAITLLKPEIIFILGDLFDDGKRCNDKEFQYYIQRLNSIFKVPENVKLYFVAGNHDMGFHYEVTPKNHNRFSEALNSPPVQLVSVRGNHFVLINSMAMEGDGCFLCRAAQVQINRISKKLRCAKGISKCPPNNNIMLYSRPIVLQHFPMYRESDRQCVDFDQASEDIKKQEFHERWNCLSREASELIYDKLKPRVIFGAHTHHGCHVVHRQDIHEYTLPSFNWRNKDNPSFTMGVFLPNNYAVKKCHLPLEVTLILLYSFGLFFILTWFLLLFKTRRTNFYTLQRKFD